MGLRCLLVVFQALVGVVVVGCVVCVCCGDLTCRVPLYRSLSGVAPVIGVEVESGIRVPHGRSREGGAEPPTGLLFPLRPYTSRVWLCVFDPWSRVEIAEGYCVLAIE